MVTTHGEYGGYRDPSKASNTMGYSRDPRVLRHLHPVGHLVPCHSDRRPGGAAALCRWNPLFHSRCSAVRLHAVAWTVPSQPAHNGAASPSLDSSCSSPNMGLSSGRNNMCRPASHPCSKLRSRSSPCSLRRWSFDVTRSAGLCWLQSFWDSAAWERCCCATKNNTSACCPTSRFSPGLPPGH